MSVLNDLIRVSLNIHIQKNILTHSNDTDTQNDDLLTIEN